MIKTTKLYGIKVFCFNQALIKNSDPGGDSCSIKLKVHFCFKSRRGTQIRVPLIGNDQSPLFV